MQETCHTVESTWVGNETEGVSEVRFYVILAAPYRGNDDDFTFLHAGVRYFRIWGWHSHLALILFNTGHFHPTHRTIGQRLSYLEDLTMVGCDDTDVVGNYHAAQT